MTEPPPNSSRPRRRRRGRFLAFVFIAAMAALAALLTSQQSPLLFGDPDTRAITFERSERLMRAQLGVALPGEPDLINLPKRLSDNGLTEGAPVFLRIFKREFELELWMKRDGLFHRFATYPICRWSGGLGPKIAQGDKQAPEGFYSVGPEALNPESRWHRSFNLGYPNAFDQSLGRTGSLIMVHGGCASVGCFAMTNAQVDEIWKLVTAAFAGGQKRFQVQVFPFRMTDEAMSARAGHPHLTFWNNLRQGYDIFEKTLMPPRVSACRGRYDFAAAAEGSSGEAPILASCPGATAKN